LGRGEFAAHAVIEKWQTKRARLRPHETRSYDYALERVYFNYSRLAMRFGPGQKATQCYFLAMDNLFDVVDILWTYRPYTRRSDRLLDREFREFTRRNLSFIVIASEYLAEAPRPSAECKGQIDLDPRTHKAP
jgi:hypothetical protein